MPAVPDSVSFPAVGPDVTGTRLCAAITVALPPELVVKVTKPPAGASIVAGGWGMREHAPAIADQGGEQGGGLGPCPLIKSLW